MCGLRTSDNQLYTCEDMFLEAPKMMINVDLYPEVDFLCCTCAYALCLWAFNEGSSCMPALQSAAEC